MEFPPLEFRRALIVIVCLLLILLCALSTFVKERRDLKKSSDCMYGGNPCRDYHEDLKALKKALDRSKCNHITTIFTSFKDDP
ncbi:unnamed protein product [Arabidopsis lyrata]|nr:unnamed protein product [Arabidopsis lyrata]